LEFQSAALLLLLLQAFARQVASRINLHLFQRFKCSKVPLALCAPSVSCLNFDDCFQLSEVVEKPAVDAASPMLLKYCCSTLFPFELTVRHPAANPRLKGHCAFGLLAEPVFFEKGNLAGPEKHLEIWKFENDPNVQKGHAERVGGGEWAPEPPVPYLQCNKGWGSVWQ